MLTSPPDSSHCRIRRRQLDAYADGGRHVQTARHVGYQLEFVDLLHHDEDAASHLLCQQRQFHIVLVLVSVADYDAVLVGVYGQYGMQFRLGACLQPDVVLVAVAHYLAHHRLHLVHLDGVDYIVLALILVFARRTSEAFGNLADTVVENVGET